MRRFSTILPKIDKARLDLDRIYQIQKIWRQIVPSDLGQHTHLLLRENGDCVVFADSPVWANIALNRQPTLLRKLNEAGLQVSNLRFRVNPAPRPKQK